MSDETRTKLVLHYGGQEFKLPESQSDILDKVSDGTGTVKLNLGDGKWLTIVTGPGIPIALEETQIPSSGRSATAL